MVRSFGVLLLCMPICCKSDRPAAPPDLSEASRQERLDDRRGSSLEPPRRQPGPARPEADHKVEATRREARKLVAGLLAAGIPHREVASVADTHGYKYFHWRYFRRARIWFEHAVRADPSYELSLYNAARCAAAQDDRRAALKHLLTLIKLDTPLSRSRMEMAIKDPDLRMLRIGASKTTPPAPIPPSGP